MSHPEQFAHPGGAWPPPPPPLPIPPPAVPVHWQLPPPPAAPPNWHGPVWDQLLPPPRTTGNRVWVAILTLSVLALVVSGSVYAVVHRTGHTAFSSPTSTAIPGRTLVPTPVPTVGPTNAAVLGPLPSGQLQLGSPTAPIPWAAAQQGSISAQPVTGGVDVSVSVVGREPWLEVPVKSANQNSRIDADVQLLDGPSENSIGIGCLTSEHSAVYSFTLTDPGYWSIDKHNTRGGYPSRVLSGVSAAANPITDSNHLSVACTSTPAGHDQLMFAINGTTVADTTVTATSTGWEPTLHLCSCAGIDTAAFRNVMVYTW